jgi:hypothetical protein
MTRVSGSAIIRRLDVRIRLWYFGFVCHSVPSLAEFVEFLALLRVDDNIGRSESPTTEAQRFLIHRWDLVDHHEVGLHRRSKVGVKLTSCDGMRIT